MPRSRPGEGALEPSSPSKAGILIVDDLEGQPPRLEGLPRTSATTSSPRLRGIRRSYLPTRIRRHPARRPYPGMDGFGGAWKAAPLPRRSSSHGGRRRREHRWGYAVGAVDYHEAAQRRSLRSKVKCSSSSSRSPRAGGQDRRADPEERRWREIRSASAVGGSSPSLGTLRAFDEFPTLVWRRRGRPDHLLQPQLAHVRRSDARSGEARRMGPVDPSRRPRAERRAVRGGVPDARAVRAGIPPEAEGRGVPLDPESRPAVPEPGRQLRGLHRLLRRHHDAAAERGGPGPPTPSSRRSATRCPTTSGRRCVRWRASARS